MAPPECTLTITPSQVYPATITSSYTLTTTGVTNLISYLTANLVFSTNDETLATGNPLTNKYNVYY